MPARTSVVAALSFALVGCLDQEADDTDVVDGKADGVTEFRLKLTTSGSTLRASESPKLSSSSTSFACADEHRTADGWRLLCTRGQERLTVIYGADDRVGATIYQKSIGTPDKRAYFRCTATTAAAGAWPTELRCTAKQPRTIVDGQMVSPFSSSIGIGIANSHLVSENGGTKLLRGMKPFRDADFDDLQDQGVKAVLIFKKPTAADEVDDEIAALTPIGVPATQIVNVQFPWKDLPDFREPCRMTVRSLKLLSGWTASGKTTFFHCTVGEDRTGYLAGLYRLLTETASVETVFEQEMCERGYSAGNPQKPYTSVAKEVDADVTPVFLKMAFKIANGELTPSSLDEAVCDTDPASDPAFDEAQWDAARYRCSASTRYRL